MNKKPSTHLHHIAISVDDIQTAIDWYQSHFGGEIDYQDDTWAILKYENIKLAFVLAHQHPPHIAFEVNRANIEGPLKNHRDNTESRYIRDPFGNVVELVAKD
ncbi:MAG: glyoxalase [Gammaproteobacteria bacterium CG11_big_fil_rev_8_21_14_0_20_46_22]|nr:MAG: glyoxalase [Gammaproteobacteria bacterium CG12_big_fil_rev_8_21_14_0_65_46_12]PIR10523.1 MAG: glyoxalase [Gammaproteobacteria bacterium CG11_big_fil_rev_8_21_14_0_20_46_22]